MKELLQKYVYAPVDRYVRDQGKRPAIRSGSKRQLRMPAVVGLMLVGGLILCTALSFIAFTTHAMPWSRMVFIIAIEQIAFPVGAVICLLGLIWFPLSSVDWDDNFISGPNLLGVRIRFSWQDVVDCAYEPTMRCLKVISNGGAVIWVIDYFLGFEEFCSYIKDRLPECSYAQHCGDSLTSK